MQPRHCLTDCIRAIARGAVASAVLLLGIAAHGASSETSISLRWAPDPMLTNQWVVEAQGLSAATLRALREATPAIPWSKVFPVTVDSRSLGADTNADLPPMLGSYQVLKDAVLFRPRYPLEPGMSYRAAFRIADLPGHSAAGSALVLSSSFRVPLKARQPQTIVSEIYPTADELPENTLKFYVQFSAPMSGGHIYDWIHLLNEAGKPVELPFLEIDEELWDPTMTRLTLFIDPGRIKRGVTPLEEIGPALENGHRYTLVIDPAWPDGGGTPLKAGFRKHFRVGPPNRTPIAVNAWKVLPPAGFTTGPLRVNFDRPIDWALARRVMNVHCVDGPEALVQGSAQTEDQERRWSFVPSRAWTPGRYQLRIQNTLEDLAGNNIGKSFEVDLFEGIDRKVTNSTIRIPFEIQSDWFRAATPHSIRLKISSEGLRSLRNDARAFVRADVRIDGSNALHDIAVRVKGRVGSFRPVDDKPSLTLDFNQFVTNQQLQGQSRIHLNNSVEDASYLHEKLGSEMFLAAGLPAPRVAHAVVTLNDRRLGLYVVKEGFTPEFLIRHFARADGNLYEPEPGPGCDVDGPMKLTSGLQAPHRGDLRALTAIAGETNLSKRWKSLEAYLYRDRFVRFLALETLLGHSDGYGQARNNYRLYADPSVKLFCFLPSGMDRLLARAQAPLSPRLTGLMARALIETPEGRAQYNASLQNVFTNIFRNPSWTNRIKEWIEEISTTLENGEARNLRRAGADLTRRLIERVAFVEVALATPRKTLSFQNGPVRLSGWEPRDPPTGGRLAQLDLNGIPALTIVAGPRTSASWRTRVLLQRGRYRFEARARGKDIMALPFGRTHGATLTVDGAVPPGTASIMGNTDWIDLHADFEIEEEERGVELSCQLRASAGQAWFDVNSLILRLNTR